MGLQRSVTDRRSHLSEAGWDEARGRFVERPVPHPFASPGAARVADDPLGRVLAETEAQVRAAHAEHLGYPYNLVACGRPEAPLSTHLVNNLGDPYAGSHYASEVCALEREAVAWLMDLWECDDRDAFWGSVGASGTEGNLWGIYLGREARPGARLVHAVEAHYSIPKAGRILGMETVAVSCRPGGAIDLDALSETLGRLGDRPVVLALTCGTVFDGGHDDVAGAVARLEAAGFGPDRRFVHLDGALNAMVLPFVDGAPAAIRPSFRHAIDSLSTSGHKMIGTPMPCGVLAARREHVERIASAVAYLRSDDTTLMGSRNGHAALAIWARLLGHGIEGYRADVAASLARAERLCAALEAEGVPAWRDPFGLTVVFPEPGEVLVRRHQLATRRSLAHAVVMPSVTDALIDRFLERYRAWWRAEGAPAEALRATA